MTVVKNTAEFGNLFERGTKVLLMSFYSSNAKELVHQTRTFFDKIGEVKSLCKGLWGDSPNEALVRLVTKCAEAKGYTVKVVPSPEKGAEESRAFYRERIKKAGFSPKHAEKPMQRVIIKF